MSELLEALRECKPLTRPEVPASDKVSPTMSRAPWLKRSRHEHYLFQLSVKLLDLYDCELAEIAGF